MSATEHMRSEACEEWHAVTNHAFVLALSNGSLGKEKMAGYLQQDYLFLEGFVRLLASSVAQAPTLADAVPGARFLGEICGSENMYFQRSFEALGVGQATQAAPETMAFQELMAEVLGSGRYELMLAVLTVAEWSYLDWATPFKENAEKLPFWLGEWITLHSGDGFSGVVSYLREQLDAAWLHIDAAARDDVTQTFRRTLALEGKFFDAAWTGFSVAE